MRKKISHHQGTKKRKNKEEPCCGSPNLTTANGNLVCTNCGTVVGRDMIGCEKRAFTTEEIQKRKRTEKKWRDMGPRTFIGQERKDSKGKVMKAKEKTLYNRLTKIQVSLVDSLERNMWEAKPKLNQLASKLNIPTHVKETAWRIYIEAAKEKLTMGRSIIGFVSAALYAAIRIHELPRLLDEVCDCQLTPRRTVHHSLGLLIKEILPSMGLKYKPITSYQLIFRFGNDLNLPMEIQNKAVRMLKNAKKGGLVTVGKDPRGLAASAIYIAAKKSKNRLDHRTQAVIADIAKITEVTLRSRAKEIRKYA